MRYFIHRVFVPILLFFILGITPGISWAVHVYPRVKPLLLEKGDRILILSPHPDDEVIACAGLIQKAIAVGAQVEILYLTEGRHNPAALIAYKKRLLFKNKSREFIQLGKVRMRESINAVDILAGRKIPLVFLDYPDSGTRTIFLDHWGQGNEYRDLLTRLDHSQKAQGAMPNAPYIGETILKELKLTIGSFRPTKIFCSHPSDRHSDHAALYLFLKASLLELDDDIPKPKVYLYIVHYNHWPKRRGLHPKTALLPPKEIARTASSWLNLRLKPRQIEKKTEAMMKFRSQIKYSRNFLLSFIRANEIFFEDFKEIRLKKGFYRRLKGFGKIKDISLRYGEDKLDVVIDFSKYRTDGRDVKGALYLFGYRQKEAFKDMPKIRLGFRSRSWCIYNLGHKIDRGGAAFEIRPGSLHFTIPASLLGRPDFILYSLKSNLTKGPMDSWAPWRIIGIRL